MKKFTHLTLAVLVATSLSGCVIVAGDRDFDESWEKQQKNNREMIRSAAVVIVTIVIYLCFRFGLS